VIFPLLATISSMTRIMPRLVVVFVVTARMRFPYMIFSISPTVGNLHQFGDSFWLLSILDVRFPWNVITESIDCSINGNVFTNL
jgi:hypothetical protein